VVASRYCDEFEHMYKLLNFNEDLYLGQVVPMGF
jgi:hypothetical protein